MTLHLHHLTGCAPRPLAFYLKAIGVLRLVAQQADEEARGFWRDEHFCLVTKLDRGALEDFFLDRYEPTPFVSPWNKGSGFYQTDDPAVGALERSPAPRFARFRAGIAAARRPLAAIQAADGRVRALKDRTKSKKGMSAAQKANAVRLKADPTFRAQLAAAEREFKTLKQDLYAPFVRSWRGGEREWLDAAMVLGDDGTPTWPSLLGTGGNDGRLDFTNNAMQRLGELFDLDQAHGAPRPSARGQVRSALWGSATADMSPASVGQFLPGGAGGANATTGTNGDASVNPWDFILMLEGAVAFRGQVSRTLQPAAKTQASVPFAVRAHAAGHATPGREKAQRGEQWLPTWSAAATWPGVRSLIAEGRAQLGRHQAVRPLDFARAIARLGVARGVIAFERFGYLERNGQSTIAVPLGRVAAGERPHARLIDDVGAWLDRLQRAARDDQAPARLRAVEKRAADAAFVAVTGSSGAQHWQAVLVAAAHIEEIQVTGTAFDVGPCPELSAQWLDAADDDTPEWRLAVALGSAAARYARGRPVDPVRAHWLPMAKGGRFATTGEQAQKRLLRDPRVVTTGRDPLGDLIAIVERRGVEATQRAERVLPLVAARGFGASLQDVSLLLDGRVDLERVVALARALMALRWSEAAPTRPRARDRSQPSEAWQAVRLCGLPYAVHDHRVPAEPSIVRRLASGDASSAVQIALHRLRTSGFRPPLVAATTDPETARRWAASLAFPIEPAVAETMAKRFLYPVTAEFS